MDRINAQAELRRILESSNINHEISIMNEPTVHDAHVYCKINNLTGQVAGPMIEKFIKQKYSLEKNSAKDCTGDLRWNDTNIEVKASLGGKNHNKFNFVQIRMNHSCIYLLTAYYLTETNIDNLGELFMFKLTKSEMKQLIVKYGGYAHGTIEKHGLITEESINAENNEKEYALRPKYGDKCWNELLSFRITELTV